MKVIFHIDESSKWQLTIGNVKNMLSYMQAQKEEISIEILANSEAVKQCIQTTPYAKDFSFLHSSNVRIAVCHNALKAHQIQVSSLWIGCEAVPSGVVELAYKQAKGYAYIKP